MAWPRNVKCFYLMSMRNYLCHDHLWLYLNFCCHDICNIEFLLLYIFPGKTQAGDEHGEVQAAAPEGLGRERWGAWGIEVQDSEEGEWTSCFWNSSYLKIDFISWKGIKTRKAKHFDHDTCGNCLLKPQWRLAKVQERAQDPFPCHEIYWLYGASCERQ